MYKPKLPTYYVDTPVSTSIPNTSRNNKTSARSSITYTSQHKPYLSARPDFPSKEVAEQEPDFNSSDANNTIVECLQLLTNNELSFVEEDPYSLSSLLSEEEKKVIKRRTTSSKQGVEKKDLIEKALSAERFRARSINVVNPTVSTKLATSEIKRDTEKNSPNRTKTADPKRKENIGSKSIERKPSKSEVFAKSRSIEQKVFLRESIYKISRAASHNYEGESPLMSTSVTARKLDRDRLSFCKGYESINLAARIATSPLTERESSHIPNYKTNYMRSPNRGISPASHRDKINKSKTELSNPFLKDGYQTALTQRSSEMTTGISLNQSNQRKHKNPAVSMSRNPQNSVTNRSEYSMQKNENQRPLESIKETTITKKSAEKKDNIRFETKLKKEVRPLRQAKIDLVEVSLQRKSVRKMKEEKMDECWEKIEEMYEKLKKTITERREVLSQNDNFVQALENAKNCLSDAQTLMKS